ncbi:hypothetical protein ACMBCM_08855, partial [Spiroplasma sp. K1]
MLPTFHSYSYIHTYIHIYIYIYIYIFGIIAFLILKSNREPKPLAWQQTKKDKLKREWIWA